MEARHSEVKWSEVRLLENRLVQLWGHILVLAQATVDLSDSHLGGSHFSDKKEKSARRLLQWGQPHTRYCYWLSLWWFYLFLEDELKGLQDIDFILIQNNNIWMDTNGSFCKALSNFFNWKSTYWEFASNYIVWSNSEKQKQKPHHKMTVGHV